MILSMWTKLDWCICKAGGREEERMTVSQPLIPTPFWEKTEGCRTQWDSFYMHNDNKDLSILYIRSN